MATIVQRRYGELLRDRRQYSEEEWRDAVFALLLEALARLPPEDVSMILPNDRHWAGPGGERSERRARIGALLLARMEEGPDNPMLLRNYCVFLRDEDPGRALELVEQRLTVLAPADPETHSLMADLRQERVRDMAPGPEREAELEKLYQSLRSEVDLRGDELVAPNFVWMKLAHAARAVGRTEEGAGWARRCIDLYLRLVGRAPVESVRSGVYYAAHVLLGEVALEQGDFDGACAHLLASVQLPPEESHGIDYVYVGFDLAERLLGLGGRQVVEDYVARLKGCCGSCDVGFVKGFAETLSEDGRDRLA